MKNIIFGLLVVLDFTVYSSFAISAVSSETLAQVGGRVITTRDVQISSILDHWFLTSSKVGEGSNKKIDKKDWWLDRKSQSDKLKGQLSLLIIENLVIAEAENFSVAKVAPVDGAKIVTQIQADFSDWSDWKSLEISQNELETAVMRNIQAKEFLKYKTESMGFQITDNEAKDYYDKNRVKFNNLPFENFKESIKEFLARRDVETRLKEWLEVLRKKYRVKILNQEI